MAMENSRNFVKGSMAPKGQPISMGGPGESQQDPVPARPGESYPDEMDDIVADKGGWSYKQAGDGRIEIVSVPPTSKLKPGTVLDPKKIAAISDAGQRARAQRALDSIQSVMSGKGPLKPVSGGAKTAASGAGGAVDVTSMRGGATTPEDASVNGVGPVEGSMPSGVGSARATIMREMPAKQPTRSSGGR